MPKGQAPKDSRGQSLGLSGELFAVLHLAAKRGALIAKEALGEAPQLAVSDSIIAFKIGDTTASKALSISLPASFIEREELSRRRAVRHVYADT